ncbi:YciI family protein [Devosia sp. FKR38]|uniref:YciI family protein n=1 Tax=Devosia sp. FKR38 TaxID=2562312 RepID=UPI0010BFB109|nr:YciI family protein [Devosia sp. FKR38]
MTQFLVAIHRPNDYDPATMEDAAMHRDIGALNQQMVDAGIRVFVGGLAPISMSRGLRPQADGSVQVTDGPYSESKEHVGGFWVLDLPDLQAALDWGRKASIACRAPVEVRPFN